MRLSKSEVSRRREVVLAFFQKNPTASVAKLNAALKAGELTGKPEKMLNIATGYKLRKEAIAAPELPYAGVDKTTAPSPDLTAAPPVEEQLKALATALETAGPVPPGELKQGCGTVVKAIPCGDGCPGCNFCQSPTDALPETLSEHAASIEKV